MAEQLQHLLETIQKDGVEKARAEADKIVSKARDEARHILDEAKKQAEETDRKAREDAEKYLERSRQALQQAGRDLLISVGQGIEQLLQETVVDQVGQALSQDFLKEIIVKMTSLYVEHGHGGSDTWDLYLTAEEYRDLAGFFLASLRDRLREGLEIHPSHNIKKGFQVALREAHLRHDFTQEAIAEEICRIIQPSLREIIRNVIQSREGN